MSTQMTAPEYWPDLTLLPDGWRLFRIEWMSGRSMVELRRRSDNALVRSTGQHRLPSGAFAAACKTASGAIEP